MRDWKEHLLNTYKEKATKHRETAAAGVAALVWIVLLAVIIIYNTTHPRIPGQWIDSTFPVSKGKLPAERVAP